MLFILLYSGKASSFTVFKSILGRFGSIFLFQFLYFHLEKHFQLTVIGDAEKIDVRFNTHFSSSASSLLLLFSGHLLSLS